MSVEAKGVIHDIGYQRYVGPRLGRDYSRRSLYSHGLRSAFGLGRSAKAKAFPWIVMGIGLLVAAILVAVRQVSGSLPVTYWGLLAQIAFLAVLFGAVVAPELVSRDLRGGVLPLYFSRPLTRTDYALAKLAAMVTALFILLAGPQLVIYIGGVFTVEGGSAIWHESLDFGRGLTVSAVYALLFGTISLVIASLAGRRAVAAALIVVVFLVTTPIYGALMGVAFSNGDPETGELTGGALSMAQTAGLVSPMTLANGVAEWWYPGAANNGPPPPGPYGPLYGLVTGGLVVVLAALLLLRYRKVAR